MRENLETKVPEMEQEKKPEETILKIVDKIETKFEESIDPEDENKLKELGQSMGIESKIRVLEKLREHKKKIWITVFLAVTLGVGDRLFRRGDSGEISILPLEDKTIVQKTSEQGMPSASLVEGTKIKIPVDEEDLVSEQKPKSTLLVKKTQPSSTGPTISKQVHPELSDKEEKKTPTLETPEYPDPLEIPSLFINEKGKELKTRVNAGENLKTVFEELYNKWYPTKFPHLSGTIWKLGEITVPYIDESGKKQLITIFAPDCPDQDQQVAWSKEWVVKFYNIGVL